jgi:hypothetical protein
MIQRIRITGGPWPERIGCFGQVAEPSAERARMYPFAGVHPADLVIHLDDDPLTTHGGGTFSHNGQDEDELWTCVLGRADVEML